MKFGQIIRDEQKSCLVGTQLEMFDFFVGNLCVVGCCIHVCVLHTFVCGACVCLRVYVCTYMYYVSYLPMSGAEEADGICREGRA